MQGVCINMLVGVHRELVSKACGHGNPSMAAYVGSCTCSALSALEMFYSAIKVAGISYL